MKRLVYLLVLSSLLLSCSLEQKNKNTFSITFTDSLSKEAQDGRLLLLLAKDDKTEPRFQISDGLTTQLVFGVDVAGMKPGDEIIR